MSFLKEKENIEEPEKFTIILFLKKKALHPQKAEVKKQLL